MAHGAIRFAERKIIGGNGMAPRPPAIDERQARVLARPGKRRGRPAAANGAAAGAGQVQSLMRALALLEQVSAHEHGATLTDLASAVELAPSTAHRLLKTLEAMSYVRQDEERSLWFVGVKAFTVGSAYARARDIVATARPLMRDLMEEVEESVNLAVLDQDEAVYLTQVECHQLMRAHALPGSRPPVHCSGVGKALLSFLPPARMAAILKRIPYPRLTERTLADAAALRAELEQVRLRGYAVDDEEHSCGMRCVAAAIFDENGDAVAAISMTGPSARITAERLPALGVSVMRTADRITAAIGGHLPERPARRGAA